MPLNIRSEEVNRLTGKLTSLAKVGKTEAVRMSLINELERRDKIVLPLERIGPFQDAFKALSDNGAKGRHGVL